MIISRIRYFARQLLTSVACAVTIQAANENWQCLTTGYHALTIARLVSAAVQDGTSLPRNSFAASAWGMAPSSRRPPAGVTQSTWVRFAALMQHETARISLCCAQPPSCQPNLYHSGSHMPLPSCLSRWLLQAWSVPTKVQMCGHVQRGASDIRQPAVADMTFASTSPDCLTALVQAV